MPTRVLPSIVPVSLLMSVQTSQIVTHITNHHRTPCLLYYYAKLLIRFKIRFYRRYRYRKVPFACPRELLGNL